MVNQQRWKIFFLLFISMFLLGGIQNTKGLIINLVQHDISLDLAQIGYLVMFFQIGFMVASIVTGYYTDKKGLKFMMFIGSILMVIGLFGTSLTFNAFFFFGFYLVIGLGIGAMLVSIVTIIPLCYKEKAGMMFNVSNALFGVGMIVTPLILSILFSHHISWRYFYVGIAVVVLIVIAVLQRVRIQGGKGLEIHLQDFVYLFSQRNLLIAIAYILFYVAAEASFMNFFPMFYNALNIPNLSMAKKLETASYVISCFAALFTIGRLIGGVINLKLGERNTLITFSILSLLFMIIGRIFAIECVYLFMIFGFTMSVLFPTASALASKMNEKVGSVMGLIYVASGIGGALSGILVGQIAKSYSPLVGFNSIIIFIVIFLILSFFMKESKNAM